MKVHAWSDLKKRKLSPEKQRLIEERARREVLLMNLRELRELSGKTQEEVAEVAQMAQSELSRAERREDHLISTLRRYVEALGGELEITAIFQDKRIRLRGV